jgi:hypothetical protein
MPNYSGEKFDLGVYCTGVNALRRMLTELGQEPSYFLEGLLYNVPTDKFGSSYGDTFVNAFNWIIAADRSEFVCVNELVYLLRNTSVTWPPANGDRFLAAITNFWNDW